MAEITVLNQINDPAFKQKIFTKISNSNSILYLKDKFNRTLPLKVVNRDQNNRLHCQGAVKLEIDFSYSEYYSVHFMLGTEKYMFETSPSIENGQIVLTLNRMFFIQNRQKVRYKVQQTEQLRLLINSINETTYMIECSVDDLNSFGCSAVINSASLNIKINDLIDTTLVSNTESPLHIQGVIRNIRPHGPEQLLIGIEFHHLLYASESPLLTMIHALHKRASLKSA